MATRWAGAVDTVGGNTLSTLVRSTKHRGCVTACGLVGGTEVALTVYPFLLRGVTIDGIDSAACPMRMRLQIWEELAGAWKPELLDRIQSVISLADLNERVKSILAGQFVGRVVVDINA